MLGTAGYALRRKGVVRGAAHIGLDIIPVVGTAKAVVELFTGDVRTWVSDYDLMGIWRYEGDPLPPRTQRTQGSCWSRDDGTQRGCD